MPVEAPATDADKALDWIERKAKRHGAPYWVYRQGTKDFGKVLQVPMWIGIRDAYDKANVMQKIEDSWNNRRKAPAFRVFLVPATKPAGSSKRKD